MGARKVYAVEASAMAHNAKRLVAGNGLSHIVEVINGRVEEVEIPEEVDVLISEPMGNLLLSERMIESYVAARDRFLKPGGLMLPGKSTIYVAPYTDQVLHTEPYTKSAFWLNEDFHGQSLSALHEEAVNSHYSTPVIDALNPNNVLAAATEYQIDFHTVTKEELKDVRIPLVYESISVGVIHGVACWFDVTFDPPDATCNPVVLNTAPGCPLTHWWQCALLLKQPIGVNTGQKLTGMLTMEAHQMQSYNVELSLQLLETAILPSEQKYDLKNPLYRCANHHQIAIPTTVPALTAEQCEVVARGSKRSMSDRTVSIDDVENGFTMGSLIESKVQKR